MEELYDIKSQVDVFIGVGTSAQVFPAATLLQFFADVPQKYFIDPNPPLAALNGFTVLPGKASDKMPELVNILMT